jgi:hypothetical protein
VFPGKGHVDDGGLAAVAGGPAECGGVEEYVDRGRE